MIATEGSRALQRLLRTLFLWIECGRRRLGDARAERFLEAGDGALLGGVADQEQQEGEERDQRGGYNNGGLTLGEQYLAHISLCVEWSLVVSIAVLVSVSRC